MTSQEYGRAMSETARNRRQERRAIFSNTTRNNTDVSWVAN